MLSLALKVPHELNRQLPSTYLKLINTLLDRVSDSMLAFDTNGEENATSTSTSSPATSSQLYGTLHLLLCLIRNKKVKAEIDPYFSRKFAESIVSTLLGLIRSYGESTIGGGQDLEKTQTRLEFWPVWISPLCVLLFELVTASMNVSETVTAPVSDTESKSPDQSAALDNSEEKSETLLSEEKESEEVRERDNIQTERENIEEGSNTPDVDVDVDDSELSLELGRLVREEVEKSSLLSDATWELIFNAISGILRGSVSLPVSGSDSAATGHKLEGEAADESIKRIRHLDPSSSQGALLLLHTLINKQKLSNRFVQSGGVQTLLALPACSHSADSPSMLSLILQVLQRVLTKRSALTMPTPALQTMSIPPSVQAYL